MDRTIVYPGAIPLDTHVLQSQRDAMVGLGALLQAAFGTSTLVDGLACTPTSPASLSVQVGPGSIIALDTVDDSAFGSLAADSSNLVKQGINLGTTALGPLSAPTTAGQSRNYLVQATLGETDGTPVALPYYNAANPGVPYVGPNNSGAAQNTRRPQTVTLGLKAGAAATTGSQATPSADSGYVPLYIITIAYGQTTITAGNIVRHSQAPIIPAKLGAGMVPGFANMQVFTANAAWTVPAGVTRIRARAWGGGGGGGGATGSSSAGGGGGGGAYAEGTYTVTSGQALAITVGSGGTAAAGANGTNGGASSVGSLLTAGGASWGAVGASGLGTYGYGGTATGGQINISGQTGQSGSLIGTAPAGGTGGGAFGSGSAPFVTGTSTGSSGPFPGGGGGGGSSGSGAAVSGGAGAAGLVIIEY
ncbi:conserved protein of unknown function (plasmid) [Rhodovastum atsumiense]|uniref:Glycine-rich domain-containing protein n=1 Tax=Rhodovastum atsumiense TaxID=504468 RepID=A0A5M6IN14_9PROT|nr:hypothetical protein [Rhodovastum atsumiense]KAA5609642.1 hypothetical protein F1189_23045 [Rhodovastum atsumiense]CAH2606508.1 conserved protein of unknown function [Rhodovastum atsumiense]